MGRRTSTTDIVDGLLIALASAGAVGLTVVAPNGVTAIEKPLEKFLNGRDKRREARRIALYLKQQKLVEVSTKNGTDYQVKLTTKGKTRTNLVRLSQLEIPKTGWDKKWRVVMFDIPEQHKTIRDFVSRHLRLVGFKQLKRSVFVYPYPVEELIFLIKELIPEIEDNLSYMVVEEIDQHNKLVKQFKNIL
jgi:phenylacetic acid degradation operon negative regulatory protein